jgi:hypothetical protein
MYEAEATPVRTMSTLDPRSPEVSPDRLLDTAVPAALLVAAASWLPAGVLLGYAVRVLRAALSGTDDLPALDDVRRLGRSGLRAAVLVTAFQLPWLCCLGGVFALRRAVDDGRFYGDAYGFALAEPLAFVQYTLASPDNGLLVVVGLLVTVAVAVLSNYAGTVALVTFAATGRLTSAFDPDTLRVGVRSPSFGRGFVLASAVGFVGIAAAWLVALVPVVGPFVAAFVELFVLVGALRLVAAGSDGLVVQGSPATGDAALETDAGTVPDTPARAGSAPSLVRVGE